jgi:hypothetical protein
VRVCDQKAPFAPPRRVRTAPTFGAIFCARPWPAVAQIVAQLVRGQHRELKPIQQFRLWFGTRRTVDEIHSRRPIF